MMIDEIPRLLRRGKIEIKLLQIFSRFVRPMFNPLTVHFKTSRVYQRFSLNVWRANTAPAVGIFNYPDNRWSLPTLKSKCHYTIIHLMKITDFVHKVLTLYIYLSMKVHKRRLLYLNFSRWQQTNFRPTTLWIVHSRTCNFNKWKWWRQNKLRTLLLWEN